MIFSNRVFSDTPQRAREGHGITSLVRGYLSQSSRLDGVLEALKHTFPCISSVFDHSVLGKTGT